MKGESVASLKDRSDIMSSWLPRKLQLRDSVEPLMFFSLDNLLAKFLKGKPSVKTAGDAVPGCSDGENRFVLLAGTMGM